MRRTYPDRLHSARLNGGGCLGEDSRTGIKTRGPWGTASKRLLILIITCHSDLSSPPRGASSMDSSIHRAILPAGSRHSFASRRRIRAVERGNGTAILTSRPPPPPPAFAVVQVLGPDSPWVLTVLIGVHHSQQLLRCKGCIRPPIRPRPRPAALRCLAPASRGHLLLVPRDH